MIEDDLNQTVDQALQVCKERAMDRAQVNKVLSAYGAYIGAEDLALDEQSGATINIDEEIDVHFAFIEHFPGVLVAVDIDSEVKQRADILQTLLKANLDWTLTQGGCFSVVPGKQQVIFSRFVAFTSEDPEVIDVEVSRFVELAQSWQEQIATQLMFPPEPESEEQAPTNNVVSLNFHSANLRV